MDSERQQRARELHWQALSHEPEERLGFLRAACGDDTSLLAEVCDRLEIDRPLEAFLLPPDQPSLAAHTRLGDFEIVRELGQGGMGVVYLARQRSLNRLVALKAFRRSVGVTEEDLRAFRLEAEKVARLKHPGIVPVHLFSSEEEIAFFVMDLVRGQSLASHLDAVRSWRGDGEGPEHLLGQRAEVSARRVAEIMADVAEALEHAHSRRIIHRDVKPANILLDEQGRPHLVDFGIAKDLGRHTQTRQLRGTPHYMSPEQAIYHQIEIDHRTDVYSLGVVMYELLTQELPYDGDTNEQIFQAIEKQDPPPIRRVAPTVPKDLATICHKAIRKSREHRYESARALADDLRRFLEFKTPLARPPSVFERMDRWARRHRVTVAVTATVLFASMIGIGVVLDRVAATRRATLSETHATELGRMEADLLRIEEQFQVAVRNAQIVELSGIRDRIDDLASHSPVRRTAQTDGLSDLERRLETLVRFATAAKTAQLRDALERYRTSPFSLFSLDGREIIEIGAGLDALRQLLDESDLGALEAQIESINPQVSFTSEAPMAEVFVQPLDPSTGTPTGETRWLCIANEKAESIAPGFYRFLLRDAEGRTGEVARYVFGAGVRFRLPTVSFPSDKAAGEDMVLIEDRQGIDSDSDTAEGNESARFWIDRYEVTNREYRRFLRHTNRPAPRHWPLAFTEFESDQDLRVAYPKSWSEARRLLDLELPPHLEISGVTFNRWGRRVVWFSCSWLDLPIVRLDVDEMEAYAAWRGMRLPTKREWLLAARGPQLSAYPWGGSPEPHRDPARICDLANVKLPGRSMPDHQVVLADSPEERREAEFAVDISYLRPGGFYPQDLTPEGVFDLYGNVWEVSCCPAVRRFEAQRDVVFPMMHVWMGYSWRADAGSFQSSIEGDRKARNDCVGFRCVRGAED